MRNEITRISNLDIDTDNNSKEKRILVVDSQPKRYNEFHNEIKDITQTRIRLIHGPASKAIIVVRNFCFIKIRIENISTGARRLMAKLWLLLKP